MSKLIIAHRKNSLKAIKEAIEIGAPMFEFDLRKTKDGKLAAFHDPHSKRSKHEIPLLTEVLELAKDKIQVNLEIKEAGYEEETIKIIKEYLKFEDIVITSFKSSVLRTIKRLEPKLKIGLIIGSRSKWQQFKDLFVVFRLLLLKADILVAHHGYLKSKAHYLAFWLKIPIYIWTVNDEKLIEKYLQDKKISAIITDKPKKALELLARRTGSLRKQSL